MALRTLHIGVGGRGVWPVGLFPQRDDVEIVGLCDIKPDKLAEAREKTGLPESVCYEDWRTALDQVECDAVVVITPPQLHYEMCLESVGRGKHVLVEKPFTMDLAEAVEVVNEADKQGVKLAVGQQARHAAGTQAAIDLIRDRDLGAPEFGIMTRFSKRAGVHHSGEQRHSYAWERGVHDFDTAWAIFNSPPKLIKAINFNPTWSPYAHGAGMYVLVEYESGAVCNFNSCFMSHRKDNSLKIETPAGSVIPEAKSVIFEPADGGEPETIDAGERRRPEAIICDGWVEWVNGGDEPVHGMHNNLWILAMVEGAGVSSDEGGVVNAREYLEARKKGSG